MKQHTKKSAKNSKKNFSGLRGLKYQFLGSGGRGGGGSLYKGLACLKFKKGVSTVHHSYKKSVRYIPIRRFFLLYKNKP
jgi:hypothetical protein